MTTYPKAVKGKAEKEALAGFDSYDVTNDDDYLCQHINNKGGGWKSCWLSVGEVVSAFQFCPYSRGLRPF
jgi:hypothetical protein